MRLPNLTLSGGAIVLIFSATVLAQNSTGPDLRQPASARNVAYDNYLYFAPQDASNAAPAASADSKQNESAPAAAAPADQCANECNANCSSEKESCSECCFGLDIFKCNLGEPWKLSNYTDSLTRRNITVGGWIEGGVFTNQYDAANNGPLGLRDKKYFDANQLWMYAERATNTEDQDWDIGGRMDYVFGTDGPDTQCFGDHGWDYGWNSSPSYGSAVPQAYAEVAYKKLKVKLGHFYTPIGNEVFPATGNFFYSHSYMFYYAEPFTHTGFLATYKFSDKLSGSAGWSDGWDSGFDNHDHASTFLGGLTWTPNEDITLAWYMCSGYWGNGQAYQGANFNNIFMNSIVLTYKLTERWTYIFQNDYATNYNRPDDTAWYGINQYLQYKINDCWGFGGRIEWFRDEDGVRVIQGNAGNYNEMAMGVNWKPRANFLVRPEVRYDWYNGTTAGGNPFDNGNATTQLSGGFDVIFTF
jgi:hypothetical protein